MTAISSPTNLPPNTLAALDAYRRGLTPIPILARGKKALMPNWTKASYDSEQALLDTFQEWSAKGCENVAVLPGAPSQNLIDVDIDHPKAARLKDYFLPTSTAVSGRAGARSSHYWFQVEGDLPPTRQYKLANGEMAIELRSTGTQTVIPDSIHPSGERYIWEGAAWGGEEGITRVDGATLNLQVAIIGLGAALLDVWPESGSRHETYLALAGALLDDAGQVHGFWERNAGMLIRVLAEVTADDDGPATREAETLPSTIRGIREGKNVVGFGKLAELVGEVETRHIRRLIYEVEAAAGYAARRSRDTDSEQKRAEALDGVAGIQRESTREQAPVSAELGDEPTDVDPMLERRNSWDAVNLLPYLSGRVEEATPTLMTRTDGAALLYPGTVNMLYGSSESAKSWIALHTCSQIITAGGRVAFVDFEDDPRRTVARLLRIGAHRDDIAAGFAYIHPEEALAPMQRNRWGKVETTEKGKNALEVFEDVLNALDPELVVLDGMTALYGLHGLNTNDTSDTDVITTWMRSLVQGVRRTVLVIDHAGKGAEKGALPIGSQHKVSMVQGTLLQAWPIDQPMPGRVGTVELVVLKDRPGQVRLKSLKSTEDNGKAQVAATVTIDSKTDPLITSIMINPPEVRTAGGIDVDTGQMTVNLGGVVTREETRKARIRDAGNEIAALILESFGGDLERALGKQAILESLGDVDWARDVKPVVDELCRSDGAFGGRWLLPSGNGRARVYRLAVSVEDDE